MHAFDSFKCPLENCTSPGVHQIFGTANELLAHIIQYHILQLVYIEPQECLIKNFTEILTPIDTIYDLD